MEVVICVRAPVHLAREPTGSERKCQTQTPRVNAVTLYRFLYQAQ